MLWRKLQERDSKTNQFYQKLRKKAVAEGQKEIDYYKIYLDIFYRKSEDRDNRNARDRERSIINNDKYSNANTLNNINNSVHNNNNIVNNNINTDTLFKDEKIDRGQFVYPIVQIRYDELFDAINSLAGKKYAKLKTQEKYRPTTEEKDTVSAEQEEMDMEKIFTAVYKDSGINFYLLINIIKADALGVTGFSFFSFSQGESIHHSEASIYSVRGMRKRVGACLSIYKMLHLDYINLEMTENNPLPTWM